MLKGYVGDYDFDRSTVDRELAKNEGKQVNVLIDNLGGSLATGLSISAAFKNHGSVNLHFVVASMLPLQSSLRSVFQLSLHYGSDSPKNTTKSLHLSNFHPYK